MSHSFVFPERYEQQLDEKLARFRQGLTGLTTSGPLPEIACFRSPKTHYRQRAEFKIWQKNGKAHYAMHQPGESKKPFVITEFPVASEAITQLMPVLLDAINAEEILRQRLFQIEFLSTLSGDMLVTLIYHKPLADEWLSAAQRLKTQLKVEFIGRSRKQKIVFDRDYVEETLTVAGRNYHYQQIEGSFTQPNARVCEQMLEWAVQQTSTSSGDLLELYCGNGNFTLPLSRQFDRVLATEISKTSVKSAQYNIEKNGIDNIAIARMSSEEFAQALDKVRDFRRLKDIDLDSYRFSTLFVDPPRAGLDDHTLAIAKRFDQILYISCNPETLIENLATLLSTHTITALAAFDQFPYTPHLEAGVVLRRI